MFRDKRLMTGLGAGLMLGAMLLQLMLLATSEGTDDPLSGAGNLPDEDQLRREAEQLGYLLHEASERWYTQAEVDNLIQAALADEETMQREPAADADEGATEETGAEAGSLPHFYMIEIRHGMASDEVGDMLQAVGLLDDPAAYREEMARLGLTVKIRAGTYTFAYKPDLETLIDAITLPSG